MYRIVKRELVFFILQVYAVFYISGFTVKMVQGERFSTPVVTAVAPVGQKQCVKECLAIPNLCKGINYQRKHLLWEIVSSTEKSESSQDYFKASIEQVRAFSFFTGFLQWKNLVITMAKMAVGRAVVKRVPSLYG